MVVFCAFSGVLSTFDQTMGLRSLDSQEQVTASLEAMGLSAAQLPTALQVLETLAMLVGAALAAAFVLGIAVFHRNRGARAALGLIAVPLVVAGLLLDSFFAMATGIAVALLWRTGARAWFDDSQAQHMERLGASARSGHTGDLGPTPDGFSPPMPRSEQAPGVGGTAGGFGGTGSAGGSHPATGDEGGLATLVRTQQQTVVAPDPQHQPHPQPAPAPAGRRPAVLALACSLTWLFTGLNMLASVVLGMGLALQPEVVVADLTEALAAAGVKGQTAGAVGIMAFALSFSFTASAIAAVLAVQAFRGREAGRVGLAVMSGATAGVGVAGMVGGMGLAVAPQLVAGLAVLAMVTRPAVRAWCRARSSAG